MTESVPTEPARFFEEYLPRQVQQLASDFSGKTSPGSVVFRLNADVFSLSIVAGELRIGRDLSTDAVLQVDIEDGAFEPLVVRTAQRGLGQSSGVVSLGALLGERDHAELVRRLHGTVMLVVASDETEYRAWLTPGGAQPNTVQPACTVRCSLDDWERVQRGESNPMELVMDGRLKISGDAQLLLALGSLLA